MIPGPVRAARVAAPAEPRVAALADARRGRLHVRAGQRPAVAACRAARSARLLCLYLQLRATITLTNYIVLVLKLITLVLRSNNVIFVV